MVVLVVLTNRERKRIDSQKSFQITMVRKTFIENKLERKAKFKRNTKRCEEGRRIRLKYSYGGKRRISYVVYVVSTYVKKM